MARSHCAIDFYISDGGVKTLCHVTIENPELNPEGDATCKVKLTPLLKTEKQIFGSDEAQAKVLAIEFVKKLLGGKSLTDMNGNRIEVTDSEDSTIFRRA